MISSWLVVFASTSPASLPPDITSIRSHTPRSSGISDETIMTVLPLVGKVNDKLIYLIFCPDVYTSRGFVEKQHRRIGEQPAPENDLLLISAGERTYFSLLIRSLYVHRLYAPIGAFFHFLFTEKRSATCTFPRLEIVALSRIFRIPKIPVARLSSVRSAKPFFIESLALLFFIRFAVQASACRSFVSPLPKIFSRSSVRPGAVKSRDTDYLSAMCFEGYVSQFGVLRAKVVDLKQHVARSHLIFGG